MFELLSRFGDSHLTLVTISHIRPKLYIAGNRSIRFHLTGTKSNRDAIGAEVRIYYSCLSQWRMVKSGSSYLSQSQLPLTFGVGKRDKIDRAVIGWPSGRKEEYKQLTSGRAYDCVEGKGITARKGF